MVLEVVDTGSSRGLGCRTAIPIPKGAFVCEYLGELVEVVDPNPYTFCLQVGLVWSRGLCPPPLVARMLFEMLGAGRSCECVTVILQLQLCL
jgi:hypothetical protein